MKAFTFVRPDTLEMASKAAAEKGTVIKAGGIDLLDRMKERVDEPDRVVWLGDVNDPSLRTISVTQERLRLGSMVTLAEIAASPDVIKTCPALAEASGLAASPQIRARATLGGNLCQHTRCGYYRHRSFPCFKRGDETCPVLVDGAVQDTAAVFANKPCASAHPSSVAPVLAACGAVAGSPSNPAGVPLAGGFYVQPRRGRASDTDVDLVLHVDIPRAANRLAAYEEVRQKAAFDWALVSCCVRVDMDGDKVKDAGVWLGSVAPTPWHADATEKALIGKLLTDETIRAAAELSAKGASPLPGNAYKVDLVKVVVRRALERLRAMK